MKLPNALLAKTLARFDSLVSEGQGILDSAVQIPPTMHYDEITGRSSQIGSGYKMLNSEKFVEWRTKAATLLALVVPKGHVNRKTVDEIAGLQDSYDFLRAAVSFLKGVKDDLEHGFLDDMATIIEAEIAADYMTQAESLLTEGQRGIFDHVPAAVLAGAVLEKALRTLCTQQEPPIATAKANGESKTLNPLIDDLKKTGVFNEAKAKQLRAWADIRNHAAHGEFDQFKRSDVEGMISGINSFLGDYLK